MWALDGASSVVSLGLISRHLLFCTKADTWPQWEERGEVEAAGGRAVAQELAGRLGPEEMRLLRRWVPQWVSVGAHVWGAEVQKA